MRSSRVLAIAGFLCVTFGTSSRLHAGADSMGMMRVIVDLQHVEIPDWVAARKGKSGREAPGTGQVLVTKDLDLYREELVSSREAANKDMCRKASGEEKPQFTPPFTRPDRAFGPQEQAGNNGEVGTYEIAPRPEALVALGVDVPGRKRARDLAEAWLAHIPVATADIQDELDEIKTRMETLLPLRERLLPIWGRAVAIFQEDQGDADDRHGDEINLLKAVWEVLDAVEQTIKDEEDLKDEQECRMVERQDIKASYENNAELTRIRAQADVVDALATLTGVEDIANLDPGQQAEALRQVLAALGVQTDVSQATLEDVLGNGGGQSTTTVTVDGRQVQTQSQYVVNPNDNLTQVAQGILNDLGNPDNPTLGQVIGALNNNIVDDQRQVQDPNLIHPNTTIDVQAALAELGLS